MVSESGRSTGDFEHQMIGYVMRRLGERPANLAFDVR
jgi:hypothetical protein